MNDQEVIMHDAKPTTDFIAHRKAIRAAGIAISLVEGLPRRFNCLADQVIRSASSVPANTLSGSGHGRGHGGRRPHGADNQVRDTQRGRRGGWLAYGHPIVRAGRGAQSA